MKDREKVLRAIATILVASGVGAGATKLPDFLREVKSDMRSFSESSLCDENKISFESLTAHGCER